MVELDSIYVIKDPPVYSAVGSARGGSGSLIGTQSVNVTFKIQVGEAEWRAQGSGELMHDGNGRVPIFAVPTSLPTRVSAKPLTADYARDIAQEI